MFTSALFLSQRLDVDHRIAFFFVDRAVPPDNRYWKDRMLYISKGTGFLFLPLAYDILHRLGINHQVLLNEQHLRLMESILDSAGRVEFDQLPAQVHIDRCIDLVKHEIQNEWLFAALMSYFVENSGKPTTVLGHQIPPLNRADSFLFALCSLPIDQQTTVTFIKYWYALITAFLLMDDVIDWKEDQQYGEENSIGFIGSGKQAIQKAINILKDNFKVLATINSTLAKYFENSLNNQISQGALHYLLNSPNIN